jgi:hypothetical protein
VPSLSGALNPEWLGFQNFRADSFGFAEVSQRCQLLVYFWFFQVGKIEDCGKIKSPLAKASGVNQFQKDGRRELVRR